MIVSSNKQSSLALTQNRATECTNKMVYTIISDNKPLPVALQRNHAVFIEML